MQRIIYRLLFSTFCSLIFLTSACKSNIGNDTILMAEPIVKPRIFFNLAPELPARINLELTAVSAEEQDVTCSHLIRAYLGYESTPGIQTSILIPNVEMLVKSAGQTSEAVYFGKQELVAQGVPGLRFVEAQIESFSCHVIQNERCLELTDWQQVENEIRNLRTIRRPAENRNTCTGCENTPCKNCHSGDDQNFFTRSLTSQSDLQMVMQNPSFIRQFLVADGQEYRPSNLLAQKAQAVAKGPAYSHPMFKPSSSTYLAFDAFSKKMLVHLKSGNCGR